MSAERRLRLTREAIGDRDNTMPGAEGFLRTIGIVALVVFVVLFSGTYPA
ncbi:MAG TPA: hypothetical protein VM073_01305 [Usitatibacter sp.]|nr:hypothetical protein [Usitatibacter sp.]